MAHKVVRLVVVRDGTAVVFSEFGQQPVSLGDAVLLGPSALFAGTRGAGRLYGRGSCGPAVAMAG